MNKLKKILLGGFGVALAGLAYYALRVEPSWLRVRYVPVRLPRLPRAFHDYRIALISDIHMGGWMTPARFQPVAEALHAIQPDLIAITGDFVENYSDYAATMLAVGLDALPRPTDGIFAVMGNHDYRYGVNRVRPILQQAGIIELENSVQTLQRSGQSLHIAGVDNATVGRASLDAVLDQLPTDGAAVLLAHEPDFADLSAPTGRFDLQLSGHAHGGQVRLPGLKRPPILPTLGQRYPVGRYQVGKMVQYTTTGLGMIPPHVRLNARPEIVILILESPAL